MGNAISSSRGRDLQNLKLGGAPKCQCRREDYFLLEWRYSLVWKLAAGDARLQDSVCRGTENEPSFILMILGCNWGSLGGSYSRLIYLSIYLSIHPSIDLFIYLSIYLWFLASGLEGLCIDHRRLAVQVEMSNRVHSPAACLLEA